MFHKSFRPSTPSWQSELYLKRARVSLTTTTAVTHAVSIPLCSQARSRHAARGTQEPNFCGVSEPRGKTRSVFELRSVVTGFFREAASQQSRVISSTRKCESNDCQPAHTPNARSRASQSILSHQCVIVWSLAKRGAGAHTKVVSEVEGGAIGSCPPPSARSSDMSRASRASW
jgi:hypothetical protein